MTKHVYYRVSALAEGYRFARFPTGGALNFSSLAEARTFADHIALTEEGVEVHGHFSWDRYEVVA